MTTTTNLGITLIETSQAQKEVTANMAFTRIDAILNNAVKDKDLAAPPASPSAGDLYIVAASPTGGWSGHTGDLAYYDQSWNFITPKSGIRVYISDEKRFYLYNGTSWVSEASRGAQAATVSASGAAVTVDCAVAETYDITLTSASVTLSFSNVPPALKPLQIMLYLRQDASGSRTVSWPAAVKWAGAAAPTLTATANKLDIITLVTIDGGTSWHGRVYGLNMS